MKELSIEEKARRYDEAIERANSLLSSNQLGNAWIYKLLPELKESEDEKIRRWIINYLDNKAINSGIIQEKTNIKNAIDWLEKQGEPMEINPTEFDTRLQALIGKFDSLPKEELIGSLSFWMNVVQNDGTYKSDEKQDEQSKNEDEGILHRFGFYSYKDEPNILYLAGLYVDNEYRNKGIGTKILEVADEVAKSINCHTIRLKTKKDSNAERLYRTHGYNRLATEESDEIWLEKQSEQKLEVDQYSLPISDNSSLPTLDESIYHPCTESVHEQNPADNEMIEILHAEYEKGRADAIAEMQKPSWSEEDEKYWSIVIAEFSKCAGKSVSKDEWMRCNDWLNSLRDKVQPKQEWSEEDERQWNNIWDVLDGRFELSEKGYKDAANWFLKLRKSLRPQSQWKPSGGQMKYLAKAIMTLGNEGNNKASAILYELWIDLKKLKD